MVLRHVSATTDRRECSAALRRLRSPCRRGRGGGQETMRLRNDSPSHGSRSGFVNVIDLFILSVWRVVCCIINKPPPAPESGMVIVHIS